MTSHRRFFENTTLECSSQPSQTILTQFDAHSELLDSLNRINTFNPPVQTCSTGWSFSGFYSGPTSIAYLFYRLSIIYPDLEFKCQPLVDWATTYLELGSFVKKPPPDPDHCGIANETLAQLSLSSILLDDASLARKLCSYDQVVNHPTAVTNPAAPPVTGNETGNGSNEWLYGRAGYLYFLRLCRSHFSHDAPTAKLITQTIAHTIETITNTPQPWTWHGQAYLGAAHGVIGILCQVVLSDPSTVPKVERLLLEILEQQFGDSGNFPSSLPSLSRTSRAKSEASDRLVQFCHRGPGFVLSLRSMIPFVPSLETKEKITGAIKLAQEDIWRRGLLTKTPSLCHGISGNALAFGGQAERGDGDGEGECGRDDARFQHFMAHTTTEMLENSDREWLQDAGRTSNFAGLFTGEAGRAWTWAVADKGLARTCIGYNDL